MTNPKRVQAGIDDKWCNALLLKVNQIGSVTESIEASNMSQAAGWGVMVSHRSGETEDNFIGDLVCGLGTGEIKSGAPCRSGAFLSLVSDEEHGRRSNCAWGQVHDLEGKYTPPE